MLKKYKTIIIVISVCLLLALAGPAIKYRHKIKDFILSHLIKIVHTIEGRSNPTRYNAVSPVAAHDGIAVFTASSLDRIFQDGKTLLKPSFSTAASISIAKNEYGSFQVVVQSQNRELNDVQVKISDLVDPKTGSTLNNANVSVRVVGYVQTIEPYYPVKYVGLWPDPLLPTDKTNINTNITQPFWVTVYTPPETIAGDYTGNISVIADDKRVQNIPLSVHVYNFVLPKESHLKTAFDYYPQVTYHRYRKGADESNDTYVARVENLNDQYIIAMLKYRMDPILNVDPTSQEELSKVDRYLVYGLNNFSIGKKGGTYNNNWPSTDQGIEDLFSLYRTYGEDLKLNEMLPYTYIYTWDEGQMGNPQVAKIASMIHRAYPDLKNMVCYHGIWDPADGADWLKDIDIWTFQIDDFNEQRMRKLQAMGKEIWMYISGPAGADTPNLAMDFDSIDYRIIPWLCWKYNIKGFLYWCVNWWNQEDPFENAKNTDWEQNGNGLLFYPGKDAPVESLRMEIFRDGMEDYEYIQLLFEDLKILKRRHLDQLYKKDFKEGFKLLTMDDSIAASMSKFTRDGELLIDRRNAIAREIERINSLTGI
jgi:hypothetical protein